MASRTPPTFAQPTLLSPSATYIMYMLRAHLTYKRYTRERHGPPLLPAGRCAVFSIQLAST